MNVHVLFLIALLLTGFMYPVISAAVYNIVLPSFNVFKSLANTVGGVLPLGGGGGDEVPGEFPYIT